MEMVRDAQDRKAHVIAGRLLSPSWTTAQDASGQVCEPPFVPSNSMAAASVVVNHLLLWTRSRRLACSRKRDGTRAAEAEAFNDGLIGLTNAGEGTEETKPLSPQRDSSPWLGRFARPADQFAMSRPNTRTR